MLLSTLNIPTRTINALTRANITTLTQLLDNSDNLNYTRLCEIKGLGASTVNKLLEVLESVLVDLDVRPVESISLSARTINALDRVGITTLNDIMALTEETMNTFKNFGNKSLQEVLAFINTNPSPTPTLASTADTMMLQSPYDLNGLVVVKPVSTPIFDNVVLIDPIDVSKLTPREQRRAKRKATSTGISRLLHLVKTVYLTTGFISENSRGDISVNDNRGKQLKSYLVDCYSQKSNYGTVTALLQMLSGAFYTPQEKGEKYDFDEVLELKDDILDILNVSDDEKIEFSELLALFKKSRGYNSFCLRDPKTNFIVKTSDGSKYMEGVTPDIEGVEDSVEELLELLGFPELIDVALEGINVFTLDKFNKREKEALKGIKVELKANKKLKKKAKTVKASL